MYLGSNVSCNCCNGHFRRFKVYIGEDGHRSFLCPRCGSLARHRVDWMYLTSQSDVLTKPISVLHVAPEVCLEAPLRRLPNVAYLSADYDSTRAMEQMDLERIDYPDATFDGVICNHVLQFVHDEHTAVREIFRVLRPGGWAMLQTAIDDSLERTREGRDPSATEQNDGRYEEIWQRRYGRDYAERLEQAGFAVTVSNFVADLAPAVQQQFGLDIGEVIYFCRKPS